MTTLPEALRLAKALEQGKYLLSVERNATAAELRRLHDLVKYGVSITQGDKRIDPTSIYSDIVSDGGLDPRNKFDIAPPQQPEPPWEAQTEAEKIAYAAGWYKSLEVQASTVNLTDEQISDLWHQSGQQPFKFARMIQKVGR